jgi:hypothetical protein
VRAALSQNFQTPLASCSRPKQCTGFTRDTNQYFTKPSPVRAAEGGGSAPSECLSREERSPRARGYWRAVGLACFGAQVAKPARGVAPLLRACRYAPARGDRAQPSATLRSCLWTRPSPPCKPLPLQSAASSPAPALPSPLVLPRCALVTTSNSWRRRTCWWLPARAPRVTSAWPAALAGHRRATPWVSRCGRGHARARACSDY